MSIAFRCPKCGHRLRAPVGAGGRTSRCKCGASVAVPAATVDTISDAIAATAPRPALDAIPPADSYEVMSAWSPLCERLGPDDDDSPSKSIRNPLLLAISIIALIFLAGGVLVVLFVGGGIFWLLRPEPVHNLDAPIAQQVAPAQVEVAAIKDVAQAEVPMLAPPPEEKPAPVVKKPVEEKAPPPPIKAVDPPAIKEPPPPEPSKEVLKLEIVEWRTAAAFSIFEKKGKIEKLELNPDGVKAGYTLVAVKVRIPPALLAATDFDVAKPDVKLLASETNLAVGCGVGDDLFFAPPMGQMTYEIDLKSLKAGFITQSWLFVGVSKDLDAGRTLLQFRDLPPLHLTAANRRK